MRSYIHIDTGTIPTDKKEGKIMKTPKYVLVLDWSVKQDDPKTHGFNYIDLEASTLLEAITEAEDKTKDCFSDLYLIKICEYRPNVILCDEKQGKNAAKAKLYKAVLCSRDISRTYAHWHICDFNHGEDPNWYVTRCVFGDTVCHDCTWTGKICDKSIL